MGIISSKRRLIVATPHGFCSGVARAVAMAESLLAGHRGQTIYCLHEIVHNRQVVERLRGMGMVFVNRVEEVPRGSVLLFSAHGVTPAVAEEAAQRNLHVVDATCPFVLKVHDEVRRFAAQGAGIVCIGHRGHQEVIGIRGEAPGHVVVVENAEEAERLDMPRGIQVAVVTQTTLGEELVKSVMAVLTRRFPTLMVPRTSDICYATRNRQQAVAALVRWCGRVLVLGAANSSNSRRLVEVANARGAEALLISELPQLREIVWRDHECLGLTSGASTPESFLEAVIGELRQTYGFGTPELLEAVREDEKSG